jgi:hypothetical protein
MTLHGSKMGKLAYWAGCNVALGIFAILVLLCFRKISDANDVWPFLEFAILISCVPWALGGVTRLVLTSSYRDVRS